MHVQNWVPSPHLLSRWQVTILLGKSAATGLQVHCLIELFELSTAGRIVHTELYIERVRRESANSTKSQGVIGNMCLVRITTQTCR